MKKSLLLSLLLYSMLASGQFNPPIPEGSVFIGRWVLWLTGEPVPHPVLSPAAFGNSDGFLDEEFHLPLEYDPNIQDYDYLDDLNRAVDNWNRETNIANIKVTGASQIPEPWALTNIQPGNLIVSVNEDLNTNVRCDQLPLLGRTEFQSISRECDDSSWPGVGPVLVSAIVYVHPAACFFDLVPSKGHYSMEAVLTHELGHLFGLNHHGTSSLSNVMYRYLEDYTLRGDLGTLDIEAINRLYGHDGRLGGNFDDDYFNSIPCDDFDPEIVGDLTGIPTDGTFNPYSNQPGVSVPPCSNCFRDEGEEGVDCGGNCALPCEVTCTGNSENKRYSGQNPAIWNQTIVNDWITLGDFDGNTPSNVVVKEGAIKNLQAGTKIEISEGVHIEKGAVVDFNIDNCNCPELCSPILPNVFTPNCDGINDFYSIRVNGWTHFSIEVKDLFGRTLYTSSGGLDETGLQMIMWNGLDNEGDPLADSYYLVNVTLTCDCNGLIRELETVLVHVINSSTCMEGTLKNDMSSQNSRNLVYPTNLRVGDKFVIEGIALNGAQVRLLSTSGIALNSSYEQNGFKVPQNSAPGLYEVVLVRSTGRIESIGRIIIH